MVISYTGSLGGGRCRCSFSERHEAGRPGCGDPPIFGRNFLPPYVGCNNPVDYTFDMNAEQVRKTIEIGLRSKGDQRLHSNSAGGNTGYLR